jgi:hypothetical protein
MSYDRYITYDRYIPGIYNYYHDSTVIRHLCDNVVGLLRISCQIRGCISPALTPTHWTVDILEGTRQDPYDDDDFELPDQHALIDAFMAGLSESKRNDNEFRSLSQLLAKLPCLSLSHAQVEAMSKVSYP